MAARDLDRLSDLLAALYGGLAEGKPWEAFLRALAAYLDATYATLILTAPGTTTPGAIMTPDADPQTSDDYAESYFASDPFKGLPEGQVTSFAEFVAGAAARDSVFYRDFLNAAGGDQILGVDIRCATGFEARFRAMRDRSRPDFERAQREAFQRLVPHLRRALALYERFQASGAEQGVYRGAVEQMGVATIILDRDARLLRTNAVADRLLAAADGVRVADGRLRLTGAEERHTLDAMLRNLDPDTPARRFRLERPSGARDLAAVAKPMPGPSFMRGGAALALLVSDPGEETALDPEAIRDLFQLTRMEATLAAALASGRALVDAASDLGITHNTARSHLRAIFAKTGARRQAQLVHLLHSAMQ